MIATAGRTPSSLSQAWADLRASDPLVRTRDAAQRLGVSEAELVASTVGDTAVRLSGDLVGILRRCPELGLVKTITRNEHAVIEKTGVFEAIELTPHIGTIVGETIELRVFPNRWRSGFAVREESARGVRESLQFFDAHGESVHKIYAIPETKLDVYHRLVTEYAASAQTPGLAVDPLPAAPTPATAEEADVARLRAEWDGLRDTHDFYPMLQRLKLSRIDAVRLAGVERARPVASSQVEAALQWAADHAADIMVFVGNRGCIQIHIGAVRRIVRARGWLNVLDPDLDLHVRDDRLDSLWVVSKPTADGPVTSLEAFDAAGEMVIQLFSKRKPGQAESAAWRAMLRSLPDGPSPH